MLKKIPNYIKYIYINVFFLLVFLILFRIIFFMLFIELEDALSQEIQKAFWLGIRFDVKLAIITFFPLALVIFIVNYRFFKRIIYKKIASFFLVLVYVILALFYVTDYGYYDYLSTRLDATSLRFLSNLEISTQVLVESYPIYKGIIGLSILGFLVYKFSNLIYTKFIHSLEIASKKAKAFYLISTFLLLSFGIYNSITHYPLRWSEAFFSKNNMVNQFALNPILYFFDSFAFRNNAVDIKKFNQYYPVIADYLNLPKDTISFKREVFFDSTFAKKPNIVIVMLESVGVASMSYYKNPIQSTPKLDTLIKQSISFSNFYVHKSGTAASVFASITGLPDIDDIKTASRNPMVIDQRILFDQFEGYEKLYFLGGSANWANIRGIFQANIRGLKIFEEGSYQSEKRADVWGIDDYDLFGDSDKVLTTLHQQKKPFIAYIQTATNHLPFTVPKKKESYSPLEENEVSENLLESTGFKSIAQLNALRYLDFNVGRFIERTKKSGYHKNTIFIFFGDHNTAMKRTDNYTLEYDLNIQLQHVPFFIYAPEFVKPKVISKNGKLIDLFPTIMSLARINHTNYTLGSNLLDSTNTKRSSFVYLRIKGEPAVGLIQDSLYYAKTTVSNHTNLYNLNTKELIPIQEKYPLIAKKMDSLLSAFYHSTKYLYFNNKKLPK